jgi:zinc transporter 2
LDIIVKDGDGEVQKNGTNCEGHQKSKVIKKVAGGHSHDNMNVRAAVIHVLGDLLQSIGVMIASAIIWWKPEYKVADPICTFLFSIIVLFTTFRITKDCIFVLMESTPKHIDVAEFKKEILSKTEAVAIHDVHIWLINEGKVAMCAHVVADSDDLQCVLKKVTKICRHYGLKQTTIQMESTKETDDHHQLNCSSI